MMAAHMYVKQLLMLCQFANHFSKSSKCQIKEQFLSNHSLYSIYREDKSLYV